MRQTENYTEHKPKDILPPASERPMWREVKNTLVGKKFAAPEQHPRAALLQEWGKKFDIQIPVDALTPQATQVIEIYFRDIDAAAATVTPQQIEEAKESAEEAARAYMLDLQRKGTEPSLPGIQQEVGAGRFFNFLQKMSPEAARIAGRLAAIFAIITTFGFGDFLRAPMAFAATDEAGKPTEMTSENDFEQDTPEPVMTVEVLSSMVTIYKEPKDGSGIVNVPPKGAQLPSTGEKDATGKWLYVTGVNQLNGWIKLASVKTVQATEATPTAQPTATNETILKATPTPEPTVQASEEVTGSIESIVQVYIPDADQNLRSGPGTEFESRGTAPAGVEISYSGTVKLPNGDIWLFTDNRDYIALKVGGKEFGTTGTKIKTGEGAGVGGGEMTPEALQALLESVQVVGTSVGITVDAIHPFTESVLIRGLDGQMVTAQAVYALTEATNGNNTLKVLIVIHNGAPLLVEAHEDPNPGNAGRPIVDRIMATTNELGEWATVPATTSEQPVQEEAEVSVEAASEMQAKLIEIMERNSDVFPKELTEQVKNMEFDAERGGWVVDADHIYLPIKTGNFGKEATLEEGTVWMPKDNFVANPDTGSSVYFGTGEKTLIETLLWDRPQEQAIGYVKAFEELLGLPPGFKLKIIRVKDVTGDDEGLHLRPGGRRDLESMLLRVTQSVNTQIIIVKDAAGKPKDITVILSTDDKIIDNGQRTPDAFADAIGWTISAESYLLIEAILNERGPRETYNAIGLVKVFNKRLATLLDRDASGNYIPFQKLFVGQPNQN